LLGDGEGRFADVKDATITQRQDGSGQGMGGEQAAEGFPVAQVAAGAKRLPHPGQEMVGEHGDKDVGELGASVHILSLGRERNGKMPKSERSELCRVDP